MTSQSGPRWPFGVDLNEMFTGFRLPDPTDLTALMAAQQRNMEALARAYDVTVRGGQEVARRHMEIMRRAMSDFAETMKSGAVDETPVEKARRQADLLKHTYESAISGLRELSEAIQATNAEAVELLNKRFTDAMDEIRALTEGKKP